MYVNFDKLDSRNLVKGPIYVPINLVQEQNQYVSKRDVQYYLSHDTQDWYAEPIQCIKIGSRYLANADYASSKVVACKKLGYKDLLICFVEKVR